MGRSYGQHGASPLSYTDIKSWSDLMGEYPDPLEVKVIKKLDSLFLENQ